MMAKAPRRDNSAATRLQPAAFPAPKQLSEEQVSEICERFGISDQHAAELRDFLDELVSHLRDWKLRDEAASRKGDRDHIIDSGRLIAKAEDELKWLGIDGRLALRSAARPLADMVSTDWLRHHFPDDVPSRRAISAWRDRRSRPELGGDQASLNFQVIQRRAAETLQAVLRHVDAVLTSALRSLDSDPRARGGVQPLEHRQNAIVNLAIIWDRIGRKVVGSPKSDFV